MQHLKQSTEVKVRMGPFMDATDGVTPETTVALGTADQAELLKHDGSATVSIAASTFAAITGCDGWYDLTLTTTDTANLGMLTVVVQDTTLCTPVFKDFMVVPAAKEDADALIIKDSAATGTLTDIQFTTTGLVSAGYTVDDSLNGRLLIFTGSATAALKNQAQTISSYNGTTGLVTLAGPISAAPVNTDEFIIV